MRTIVNCILAVAVLAGCASAEQSAARREEGREVVTGSNIPRRDTAGTTQNYGREALEHHQRSGKPPFLPQN